MRHRKPTPGTHQHREANAFAELIRHRVNTISTFDTPAKRCAVVDSLQTPWRETWQEVLADYVAAYPEPEVLILE